MSGFTVIRPSRDSTNFGLTRENNLTYNAMRNILDETIPIGRTNEWDLQLRDVLLRL